MTLAQLKQKLHPFELTLKAHAFLEWPAMTRKEMRILKEVFLSFPSGKPINIFEYGMGFSTIYFAKFLHKNGRDFQMDSLDNNRFWYEKVTTMTRTAGLSKTVHLHLREFVPFWEKNGWDWKTEPRAGAFGPNEKAEQEYIHLPQNLNKTYDVIFVDARFRRRCLEAALKAVSPQGFVIMHDAQKPHYQSATKLYRYSQFIDSGKYFPFARRKYQLWLGSPANPLVDKVAAEFK
ncbi:MAG: class I SAM-dependent methyltransferase [Candidatus Omnitrophica bacterium]|nr:class I SAM-dependent methyltransferase [Candidatus Omnitrophota bacterium]